jgi:NAD(P) transhydrogenase subunit alpha
MPSVASSMARSRPRARSAGQGLHRRRRCAGLAAIGTAAGLGAIVRANDTRAEVADQVVSLGGEFVKVDYEEEGSGGGGYAKVMSEGFQQAQREMYAKQAREVDIIITTALIPGKPAPRLITAEMVKSMKPGSVIVDMAAEQGGNCELTEPGQGRGEARRDHHRLHRSGLSRLAKQSSTLYATNLFRLAEELCKTKDGVIDVNMEDDAIRGLTVIKEGNITWPPPAPKLPAAAKPAAKPAAALHPRPKKATATAAAANRCRQQAGHHVWRCRCAVLVDRRNAPQPSSGTSPSLCWPASWATWWSGTSSRRCTRR